MSELFDSLKKFLDGEDFHYSILKPDSVLAFNISGYNGNYRCYAQIKEKCKGFFFYVECPFKVPISKMAAVSELLHRINFGLLFGNFELECDDYEIRYKTSLDLEEIPLSAGLFKNPIYTGISLMDKSLPVIAEVVYGNKIPSAANYNLKNERKKAPAVSYN